MDPVAFTTGFIGFTIEQLRENVQVIKQYKSAYTKARFDSIGSRWLPSFVNVGPIQTLHWNINCWKDEEVKAWKDNCISGYAAVAVASSIFASVGLSSLQLPGMVQTHWSARALLSSSMATGVLSLAFATNLYREVSRLQNPLQIRLWLSNGKSKQYYQPPFNMFPLKSSISALAISEIPANLLNLAVILYLIGFGLYLLYSWLNNVTDIGVDNRSVFIFFVVTVVVVTVFWRGFSVARESDSFRTSSDFELTPSEDFVKPKSQKQLESMLGALQAIQELNNKREDSENHQSLLRVSRSLREILQEMQQDQERRRNNLRSGALEAQRSPVDEERLNSLMEALQSMLAQKTSSKAEEETPVIIEEVVADE